MILFINDFGFEIVTKNSLDYSVWPEVYPGDSHKLIKNNIAGIKMQKFLRDVIKFPERILKK